MSDTTTTDSEPQTEPVHDPGPDFKAKVREVLEEILPDFLTKEPEPEPTTSSKPRSLRQEESDMEHLVEKVLGKLGESPFRIGQVIHRKRRRPAVEYR